MVAGHQQAAAGAAARRPAGRSRRRHIRCRRRPRSARSKNSPRSRNGVTRLVDVERSAPASAGSTPTGSAGQPHAADRRREQAGVVASASSDGRVPSERSSVEALRHGGRRCRADDGSCRARRWRWRRPASRTACRARPAGRSRSGAAWAMMSDEQHAGFRLDARRSPDRRRGCGPSARMSITAPSLFRQVSP